MRLTRRVNVTIIALAFAALSHVYICTGGSATKYHSPPNCRGLNRCKGDVIKISIKDARNQGRTACKICIGK
ncbi:hypothetical protein [Porphyromonas endodontalis]|uniref:hypothetical protein n=1 Tax=Porphyromonas endodontalis TaxID=28124 RepID=UPI0028ECB202|nr:hypothetical protein [Porphyromonas endodontalis]